MNQHMHQSTGASTPIDEESLKRLVDHFYARVRADRELGPIFNDAVHDWPAHLSQLSAFWSSVMLGTGRYKGQPVPAHARHRDRITPALFERWLALWNDTTAALMPTDAAAALQAKAARIAESLQLSLFFRLPETGGRTGPQPTSFQRSAAQEAAR